MRGGPQKLFDTEDKGLSKVKERSCDVKEVKKTAIEFVDMNMLYDGPTRSSAARDGDTAMGEGGSVASGDCGGGDDSGGDDSGGDDSGGGDSGGGDSGGGDSGGDDDGGSPGTSAAQASGSVPTAAARKISLYKLKEQARQLSSLVSEVSVSCDSTSGKLRFPAFEILCDCSSCSSQPAASAATFTPVDWETHCGKGAMRKWRCSIYVGDTSLEHWMVGQGFVLPILRKLSAPPEKSAEPSLEGEGWTRYVLYSEAMEWEDAARRSNAKRMFDEVLSACSDSSPPVRSAESWIEENVMFKVIPKRGDLAIRITRSNTSLNLALIELAKGVRSSLHLLNVNKKLLRVNTLIGIRTISKRSRFIKWCMFVTRGELEKQKELRAQLTYGDVLGRVNALDGLFEWGSTIPLTTP